MLRGRADGLIRVAEELRYLVPGDTPPGVLLFVDQAEELLTLAGPQEAAAAASALRRERQTNHPGRLCRHLDQ